VTGCAAGIQAETSRERPTINGVGSAIGTLTIRNAYVGGPVSNGGTAPVLLSVFNDGAEPDQLVGISSPEAGSGTVPPDVTLPSGGQQLLYTPDRAARLNGVNTPMQPGQIVPIVLTFQRAGQLQMSLPVETVGPDLLSPSPSASASASPSGSPSASPSASATPSSAGPATGPLPSGTPSPYSSISP
jgi:copper(I)-binding protein